MTTDARQARRLERSCAIAAFSTGICRRARLLSGAGRGFAVNPTRTEMYVPYPAMTPGWTLRTWTCAIALQCSPSKQRIAGFTLSALSARQTAALSRVEGGVALGWLAAHWPGMVEELHRFLPDLDALDADMEGEETLERAMALARSGQTFDLRPILGTLPLGLAGKDGILAALKRAQGRMPWSTNKRYVSPGFEFMPARGESQFKSSRLPTASRPEEDDIEIRADRRAGIPYPERNMWSGGFLPDHVAVLERRVRPGNKTSRPVAANLRRWFEEHTHRAMKNRLEDGSDLDIGQYIEHHIKGLTGMQSEARVFRDLLPVCRVEVTCLRDFDDVQSVTPGELGLIAGGYTRLGAPLQHLTSRLLQQPSERRLLIIIGDGLISDEGYEGHYAWADSAHAVEEAEEAGVSLFYIGVGQVRVDPLPDVFGQRRSTRIRHVDELPRVLARVHRELVAA